MYAIREVSSGLYVDKDYVTHRSPLPKARRWISLLFAKAFARRHHSPGNLLEVVEVHGDTEDVAVYSPLNDSQEIDQGSKNDTSNEAGGDS